MLNATCAEYADVEALELFASDVDVITYEFENVPAAAAMVLDARRPVLPNRKILETTQDRLAEKDFVTRLGIGTAPYADVTSVTSLREAIVRIGLPAVLKTRRFGYDGKGQAIIREGDDIAKVWTSLGTKQAILEAFVPFEREISVIAARSAAGQVECFDVTENEHRDHILKVSRAPAPILICSRMRHAASPAGSRARSTMSVFSRSRCSCSPTAPGQKCWSTRSPRACTIPVTGRSTALRSHSSSSTSVPLPAGRSASRCATVRSSP